jgi:hypothetical protein
MAIGELDQVPGVAAPSQHPRTPFKRLPRFWRLRRLESRLELERLRFDTRA